MAPDSWRRIGLGNLSGFVEATAGRNGAVRRSEGATFVSSPVPVPHGYLNAAIPTRPDVAPERVVRDAIEFFAGRASGFVLWAPAQAADLVRVAERLGGVLDGWMPPAMATDRPLAISGDVVVTRVDDSDAEATFRRVAEAGYETPGLGRVLAAQDAFNAPGTSWFVARRDGEAVGVAAGFLGAGTGGVYFVATPPDQRGKGVGAAVTSVVSNTLLESGASFVVLQSSQQGAPLYERLGYRVTGHLCRLTFPKPSTR